jgi:hypothetical protein
MHLQPVTAARRRGHRSSSSFAFTPYLRPRPHHPSAKPYARLFGGQRSPWLTRSTRTRTHLLASPCSVTHCADPEFSLSTSWCYTVTVSRALVPDARPAVPTALSRFSFLVEYPSLPESEADIAPASCETTPLASRLHYSASPSLLRSCPIGPVAAIDATLCCS